jgi:hypothetical protein
MEPLPPALSSLLVAYEARVRGWESLSERDRQRYAAWVAAAKNEKAAQRRAEVVIDRIRDGRGWAGPLRRFFARHYSVPMGSTGEDVWRADHRGDTPTG